MLVCLLKYSRRIPVDVMVYLLPAVIIGGILYEIWEGSKKKRESQANEQDNKDGK